MNRRGENQLQNLEVRFNKIDRNKDGIITREEFAEELRENGLPIHLADSFVAKYDANGDGIVSKQEYLNAFSKFDVIKYLDLITEEAGVVGIHNYPIVCIKPECEVNVSAMATTLLGLADYHCI
ncbi:unnamed protein product [Echinostoma caproni]|uniref:EF-hand domain-containing protein n=1 Tax=Echinostoma caproni TaxID=27848 RepID=A0A183AI26_9TREM|nr:unnamed protein product [Echinostoma caproni]